MKEARAQEEANGGDFVSLFINAYHKSAPGHKLADVFATQQLQGLVSPQSSDAEVEKAIRASVQDAIDNSFNVCLLYTSSLRPRQELARWYSC